MKLSLFIAVIIALALSACSLSIGPQISPSEPDVQPTVAGATLPPVDLLGPEPDPGTLV